MKYTISSIRVKQVKRTVVDMTVRFSPLCPFIRICIYCDGNSVTLRTKDGCAWLRHFVLSFPSFDGKCRFRKSPSKLWIWPHSVKGGTFRLNMVSCLINVFPKRKLNLQTSKKTVWFLFSNIVRLQNVFCFVGITVLGFYKRRPLTI